jgi:hypothetical protein
MPRHHVLIVRIAESPGYQIHPNEVIMDSSAEELKLRNLTAYKVTLEFDAGLLTGGTQEVTLAPKGTLHGGEEQALTLDSNASGVFFYKVTYFGNRKVMTPRDLSGPSIIVNP